MFDSFCSGGARLMRNVAKKYSLTLYPLTDIHIGSGEELEPFEYTLKEGYLYKFDMSNIYNKMDSGKKDGFLEKLKLNNLIEIRKWICKNYNESWGYIYKEYVSNEFKGLYEEKIKGTKNKNENNQLKISKFVEQFGKRYIPGSSLKGALRTAFLYSLLEDKNGELERINEIDEEYNKKVSKIEGELEKLEKESLEYNKKEKEKGNLEKEKTRKLSPLMLKLEAKSLKAEDKNERLEPKTDPFKTLKIFDSEEIDSEKFSVQRIESRLNNVPFETTTEVLAGINSFEINSIKSYKGIKFNVVLSEYIFEQSGCIVNEKRKNEIVKSKLSMEDILNSLNTKLKSIIQIEKEKEIFSDEEEIMKFYGNIKRFYENLEIFYKEVDKLNENYGFIRIGKNTGKNDKTINLLRNKPENSRTILDGNGNPMGWALIKIEELED